MARFRSTKRKPSVILIQRSKSGDSYFDGSTDELKRKAYLKVFRDNFKFNWYPEPTCYISEATKQTASVSDEDAAKLPDVLRLEVEKAKATIQREMDFIAEELEWWNELNRVLDLPDEEALVLTRKGKRRVRRDGKLYLQEVDINVLDWLVTQHNRHEYEMWEAIELQAV